MTGARGDANGGDEAGFTLLELLVALGVFAVAALTLARLDAYSWRATADVRQSALAGLVAHNLAVERLSDPQAPPLGQQSGRVKNAGQEWIWHQQVSRPGDRPLARIAITVSAVDGRARASLILVRADQR